MKTNEIYAGEKLKKSLEISLELVNRVNRDLSDLIENEKAKFTQRQLEFRRDDAKALISKYKNKKFEPYKKEIFNEIKKKYLHLKNQKNKIDEKFVLYEKFISEINSEMKITDVDKFLN